MKKQDTLINYPSRVNIIGVPISAINMRDCLNFIDHNFDLLNGKYICCSNVHTTVMAHEDKKYLRIQSESIISLPDGKPLSVVGRKKGFTNMEKVTGTLFMKNIFTDKRFLQKKHYFYGTDLKSINKMINQLDIDYPKLNICGYEPSVFRKLKDSEIEELVSRINETNPDFIWIGIGAPRQEVLMNKMQGKTKGIMVGVGGAFKIFAQLINDAPLWMQNSGLEWLYRLSLEPKRLFKRYFITNSKFIFYLIKGCKNV